MGGLVLPGSGGGYTNPIATPVADYDFKQGSLYGPALSVSRASAAYIDDLAGNWTLVPANALRRSDKGALIEGQQTNSLRNNSMQGAVAGTPGVLPTNWIASVSNGLSTQVVGTGVEGGIDYVDVRFFGTTTNANLPAILADSTTAISASPGQLWTASAFLRLVAGSLSNVNVQLCLSERGAGGTNIGDSGVNVAVTGAALGSQRFAVSRTLTASAASVTLKPLQLGIPSGVSVDFTLRIGWPQLEQWSTAVTAVGGASSPIRTTGAAATRAADVVTASLAQALSAATIAAVYDSGRLAPLTGSLINLFNPADALNNRLKVYSSTADNIVADVTSAGAVVGQASVIGVAQGRRALAAGFQSDGTALSVLGSTPTVASPGSVPPSITRLSIGSRAVGDAALSGYIERLAVLPVRMVNAELQRLSALATWGG